MGVGEADTSRRDPSIGSERVANHGSAQNGVDGDEQANVEIIYTQGFATVTSNSSAN